MFDVICDDKNINNNNNTNKKLCGARVLFIINLGKFELHAPTKFQKGHFVI